jgi:hypothetical protein
MWILVVRLSLIVYSTPTSTARATTSYHRNSIVLNRGLTADSLALAANNKKAQHSAGLN